MDDGGMSIRLDPRRLGALKLLAAEAGVRPGELVTRWVEERLDAARGGATPPGIAPDGLAALAARVEDLARRLDQMAAAADRLPVPAASAEPATALASTEGLVKRGRGRPRKVAAEAASAADSTARPKRAAARQATGRRKAGSASKVALHDEIQAVISERGPQTAAELASAIAERGNYRPPRSAKPLDAAAVNARVSNPTYRGRFVRREHRIGLATG
jgi:hypothetical protein